MIGGALIALSPSLAQQAKPDLTLLPYRDKPDIVSLPGGRQLHMVCIGHGSPTVVMTAGLGDWSITWNKVQPIIARKTRVCAWDRAGFGFSGPSPEPQTVDRTTTDLENALKAGGIRGPYVMVGHSLGGYETLIFKDRHPTDVVGMVLVDPAYPDQASVNARIAPEFAASQKSWDDGGAAVARRGESRLKSGELKVGGLDPDGCLALPPDFPRALRERSERLYVNSEMWATAASLFGNFEADSRISINAERNFGDMPLIVLTAGSPLQAPPGATPSLKSEIPAVQAEWQRQHDRLASLSIRGSNRRVEGSQHGIQQMKPQAVIDAIEEVLGQATAKGNQRGSGGNRAASRRSGHFR
ncbi:MAG: alpha/beta hydrolase [Sphingomonas bacterium]